MAENFQISHTKRHESITGATNNKITPTTGLKINKLTFFHSCFATFFFFFSTRFIFIYTRDLPNRKPTSSKKSSNFDKSLRISQERALFTIQKWKLRVILSEAHSIGQIWKRVSDCCASIEELLVFENLWKIFSFFCFGRWIIFWKFFFSCIFPEYLQTMKPIFELAIIMRLGISKKIFHIVAKTFPNNCTIFFSIYYFTLMVGWNISNTC